MERASHRLRRPKVLLYCALGALGKLRIPSYQKKRSVVPEKLLSLGYGEKPVGAILPFLVHLKSE